MISAFKGSLWLVYAGLGNWKNEDQMVVCISGPGRDEGGQGYGCSSKDGHNGCIWDLFFKYSLDLNVE